MFQLVLKDILIQKKIYIFAIFYLIAFQGLFHGSGNLSNSMAVIFMSIILLFSADSLDDKNRSDILLNSLPITRKDIVLAKYAGILLVPLISLVISLLVLSVQQLLPISTEPNGINGFDTMAIFIIVALVMSIYYPFYFKFGRKIARIIYFIIFFLIFATFSAIDGNDEQRILSFFKNFENISQSLQYLIVAWIVISIMFLSLLISLRIYNRKDL